jgi:hypothetical protein
VDNENELPPVDEFDDAPTTKRIPFESMRALVFEIGYNQLRSQHQ